FVLVVSTFPSWSTAVTLALLIPNPSVFNTRPATVTGAEVGARIVTVPPIKVDSTMLASTSEISLTTGVSEKVTGVSPDGAMPATLNVTVIISLAPAGIADPAGKARITPTFPAVRVFGNSVAA